MTNNGTGDIIRPTLSARAPLVAEHLRVVDYSPLEAERNVRLAS